jgi:ribosomal protein S6
VFSRIDYGTPQKNRPKYFFLTTIKSIKENTLEIMHTCNLNKMVLNNQWLNDKMKREIKKNFKTNENRNTTYPGDTE